MSGVTGLPRMLINSGMAACQHVLQAAGSRQAGLFLCHVPSGFM